MPKSRYSAHELLEIMKIFEKEAINELDLEKRLNLKEWEPEVII